MPATRRIPKCRHNKTTGRAVVTLNGVDHWLGKHGTPESREKYDRLIHEWLGNGRTVPRQTAAPDATIIELVDRFWTHAQAFYVNPDGSPAGEADNYKQALRPLKALYAMTKARDFGPKCLRAVQQKIIEMGWCRTFINRQVGRLKHLFQWAASQEIILAAVYQSLLTVKGLRKGKSEAEESEKVRPADEAHVEMTKQHLPPTVKAMIDLQPITGMRSTEVCVMRGCDINTSDEKLWAYRSAWHKTKHHEHERTVYLGPQSQEIIRPLLKPSVVRDGYDKSSYRRAIARACYRPTRRRGGSGGR